MPLFIAISVLVAASTAILLHQYRHHAFDAPDDAAAVGSDEAATRAA
jgi:hypothetical protein